MPTEAIEILGPEIPATPADLVTLRDGAKDVWDAVQGGFIFPGCTSKLDGLTAEVRAGSTKLRIKPAEGGWDMMVGHPLLTETGAIVIETTYVLRPVSDTELVGGATRQSIEMTKGIGYSNHTTPETEDVVITSGHCNWLADHLKDLAQTKQIPQNRPRLGRRLLSLAGFP